MKKRTLIGILVLGAGIGLVAAVLKGVHDSRKYGLDDDEDEFEDWDDIEDLDIESEFEDGDEEQ